MKALLLFISLISLSACATVGKFETRMEAKKGLTKEQLIDEMGIPDREYTTSGFQILEYNQSHSGTTPRSSSTVVNGYLINTTSQVPYTTSCKLEFKLIEGKVSNYRYAGDMCRSR